MKDYSQLKTDEYGHEIPVEIRTRNRIHLRLLALGLLDIKNNNNILGAGLQLFEPFFAYLQ